MPRMTRFISNLFFFRRSLRNETSCPISFSPRSRKKLHWSRFISH